MTLGARQNNMVRVYRDRDWLWHKYMVLGHTTYKIGKICGVDESTIRYWMEKYDMPRRASSEYRIGRSRPKSVGIKVSKAMTNRILSEEHKANLREAWTPEKRDEASKSRIGSKSSKETRAKISEANIGEKHPNFNNWASREPYCHLWNEPLREKYRNYWGRVCVLSDILRSTLGSGSGLDDFEGYEIFSSRRLAVHHTRGDKMEGCNSKEMALVPIQNRFNSKKFNGVKLEDNPFYITLFMLKDIERKHREEMLGSD
jgi:transposase